MNYISLVRTPAHILAQWFSQASREAPGLCAHVYIPPAAIAVRTVLSDFHDNVASQCSPPGGLRPARPCCFETNVLQSDRSRRVGVESPLLMLPVRRCTNTTMTTGCHKSAHHHCAKRAEQQQRPVAGGSAEFSHGFPQPPAFWNSESSESADA